MTRSRVPALAGVTVLLVVAGLTFSPAFGATLRTAAPPVFSGRFTLAVVLAVALPVLAVAALRHPRVPSWGASVGGLLAVAVTVALTGPGGGVARGPYQLLTAALPVAPDGPPLTAVTAVVGLAALIAALAVTGARRPVWGLLPPAVVLAAAVALDAGPGQPGGEWAFVVVVAVLLALAGLARARAAGVAEVGDGRRPLLALLGLVVVVAAVTGLAVVVAPAVPGTTSTGRAADPRNLVPAPLVPSERVSPLQQFLALRQGSPLLRLTGRATAPVDLPFVTLDRFDGRVWTSVAGYRRSGRTLPVARDAVPAGPEVDVDVTAEAGSLGWLPRVGVTRTVEVAGGSGLGLDESTGDLVVPAGSSFPPSWRVSGRAELAAPVGTAAPAVPALLTARAARTGVVVDGDDPVPDEVRTFAAGVRGSTDLRALQGLVQRMRASGWVQDDSADAPGGHGWFQIVALLSADPPIGAASDDGAARLHRGTPEQYASAFAAIARVAGFRSRVVMGLRPDFEDDGRFTAGGADVWAWPQVRFDGVGWVTFDPTPSRRFSQAEGDTAPPPSAAGTATPSDAPSSQPATTPPAPDDDADAGADRADGAVPVLPWALTAAVVVLLVVLGPGGVRVGRRARRRRADPPDRAVAGAWAEAVGDLDSIGVAVPARPTTAEVVAAAPGPLQPALRRLGDDVDRAGYAPEPAGQDRVEPAWQAAEEVRRAARASVSPWRRVLAVLDPRPLRRH